MNPMDELAASRRCRGTNRDGLPCGRYAIPGGTVCAVHGGKAPQTIAAAKLRLLEGVEPAIARLIRFIESPPGLCATCGRCDDTAAIVSAIRTLLDRAGLGPHSTTEIVTPPRNIFADYSSEQLRDRLRAIADSVASLDDDNDAIQDEPVPIPDGNGTPPEGTDSND